jgi:hypothetical protein
MVAAAIGMVLGRALLAERLDIPWELINQMAPGVAQVLRIEIVPDGIFAALTFLIIWLRFR